MQKYRTFVKVNYTLEFWAAAMHKPISKDRRVNEYKVDRHTDADSQERHLT